MNFRTLMTVSAVCASLLATGCGDSTATTDAAPSTPPDQLVLTGSELPAGAKKVSIPDDQLRESMADFAGVQSDSTITPAECKGPQLDLEAASKAALSDSAVAAVVADTTVLSEFVAARPTDLSTFAEADAKCPKLSINSVIEGERVDSEVTVDMRKPPAALNGIDAIATYSTATATTATVPDAPVTTATYAGWATLRGTTVAVRVTSLSDTLDEVAAEKFFVDAVRKVKDAK
ncbi:hypothetical protein [Nocardia sp. NPDC050406]|uniref:hypothetical protein n=1 Tax=Nocardia sp. NPDC050406 TaxID=3364318 RepID=UPI00378C9B7A